MFGVEFSSWVGEWYRFVLFCFLVSLGMLVWLVLWRCDLLLMICFSEVSSSRCVENISSRASQSQIATKHHSEGCSSVPSSSFKTKASTRAAKELAASRSTSIRNFTREYPSRYPCPKFYYCWWFEARKAQRAVGLSIVTSSTTSTSSTCSTITSSLTSAFKDKTSNGGQATSPELSWPFRKHCNAQTGWLIQEVYK